MLRLGAPLALAALAFGSGCASIVGADFDNKQLGAGGGGGGGGGSDPGLCPDGPGSCLLERGLVLQYFIDEATEGMGPAILEDAGPSPGSPAGIQYDSELHFEGGTAGMTDLDWNPGADQTVSGRVTAVGSTKIGTLATAHRATIEVVVSIDSADDQGSPLLGALGGGEDNLSFGLAAIAPTYCNCGSVPPPTYAFMLHDTTMATYTAGAAGRQVVHLVVNADDDAPLERAKLYIDGAETTAVVLVNVPGGEAFGVDAAADVGLGSNPKHDRVLNHRLYYAALYDSALSADEVANNAAYLQANDDE